MVYRSIWGCEWGKCGLSPNGHPAMHIYLFGAGAWNCIVQNISSVPWMIQWLLPCAYTYVLALTLIIIQKWQKFCPLHNTENDNTSIHTISLAEYFANDGCKMEKHRLLLKPSWYIKADNTITYHQCEGHHSVPLFVFYHHREYSSRHLKIIKNNKIH